MERKLKRYEFDLNSAYTYEDQNGEYVKFSDIEPFIEALKTAHHNACSCCDSNSSVEEHCLEALKSIGVEV